MESAMRVLGRSWAGLLLLAALGGCSRQSPPSAGTGAKEAAQEYYEAMIRRDWQQAHASLDPESRKHCTLEQFTRLADSYRRHLGFEPEEVHIQSCEEKGPEATAHVVLTGRSSSRSVRYRDGIPLRQTAEGWRIVLRSNFGRKTSEQW
jgi:hypothetical protein